MSLKTLELDLTGTALCHSLEYSMCLVTTMIAKQLSYTIIYCFSKIFAGRTFCFMTFFHCALYSYATTTALKYVQVN